MSIIRYFALLLFIFAALPALAQCTLWNPTCNSYSVANSPFCVAGVPGYPNCTGASFVPSLPAFASSTESSFQSIRQSTASLPATTRTILSGQNWPCQGATLAGTPTLGGYCKPFATMLGNLGITTQDIFVWQYAMASSYEYSLAPGTYALTGDCVGNDGAGGIYLKYGSVPGAGSGPHCKALYSYDQTFSTMRANGWTIRDGNPGVATADVLVACGTEGVSNFTIGPPSSSPTVTATQYINCVQPLHAAQVARWNNHTAGQSARPNIAMFQVMVEPTGAMYNLQIFNVTDMSQIIDSESAALKAIQPTILIGASGTGISWPLVYDNAYWADWTNPTSASSYGTAGSTYAALDYYVLDLFIASCIPGTTNPSFPGQYYYAARLQAELGGFSTTSPCVSSCATTAVPPNTMGYVARAEATGKPLHIGQIDSPYWCQASSPFTSAASQILGQYDVLWDTSGLENDFLMTIVPWARAHRIASMSLFFTAPLMYYSTNQADDNASAEAALVALSRSCTVTTCTPTDSGYLYGMLNRGNITSLNGTSTLTSASLSITTTTCPSWSAMAQTQWQTMTLAQWACMTP